MHTPVTDEQKRQIAEMRAKRVTNMKIAEALGLHYRTVTKLAAKMPMPDDLKIKPDFNKPATLSIRHAKPVITSTTKITIYPRSTHEKMPHCAASTTKPYEGGALAYRGRQC